MKRDIFDQYEQSKRGGGSRPKGKAPPDCPKSDGMSPFTGIAFSVGEMYVRLNGTEGRCTRLVTVGGTNFSTMINFSRTCGAAGEYKRRIAENLSTVFFQGGLDWVKHDNDTIEVVTEEGTFEVTVSEEKYAEMVNCWQRGCGCEQAKNPKMKAIFIAMLVIAAGGLGYDSVKVTWDKIVGKKPPKHVECKKGHRMEKVDLTRQHYCDICSVPGTMYRCRDKCVYDMCKACYDDRRGKVKAAYAKWLEQHPEEKKKGKKEDDDEKEGKETEEASKSEAESESKSGKEEASKSEAESEPKSGKEDGKSEASGDPADAAGENGGEEGDGGEKDEDKPEKGEE